MTGIFHNSTSTIRSTTEQAIRRDGRVQLAALLRENADILARFAADKSALVGLIALMLELPNDSDRVAGVTREADTT